MARIKLGNDWPFSVSKKDLLIEAVKGSGPGGQKRNKTSSGIRLTHLPTGISVRSDEQRMQSQNLKSAWKKLCAKLVPLMLAASKTEIYKEELEKERIRTYNERDNRILDTRLEGECFEYSDVLKSDGLNKIIEKLKLIRNN